MADDLTPQADPNQADIDILVQYGGLTEDQARRALGLGPKASAKATAPAAKAPAPEQKVDVGVRPGRLGTPVVETRPVGERIKHQSKMLDPVAMEEEANKAAVKYADKRMAQLIEQGYGSQQAADIAFKEIAEISTSPLSNEFQFENAGDLFGGVMAPRRVSLEEAGTPASDPHFTKKTRDISTAATGSLPDAADILRAGAGYLFGDTKPAEDIYDTLMGNLEVADKGAMEAVSASDMPGVENTGAYKIGKGVEDIMAAGGLVADAWKATSAPRSLLSPDALLDPKVMGGLVSPLYHYLTDEEPTQKEKAADSEARAKELEKGAKALVRLGFSAPGLSYLAPSAIEPTSTKMAEGFLQEVDAFKRKGHSGIDLGVGALNFAQESIVEPVVRKAGMESASGTLPGAGSLLSLPAMLMATKANRTTATPEFNEWFLGNRETLEALRPGDPDSENAVMGAIMQMSPGMMPSRDKRFKRLTANDLREAVMDEGDGFLYLDTDSARLLLQAWKMTQEGRGVMADSLLNQVPYGDLPVTLSRRVLPKPDDLINYAHEYSKERKESGTDAWADLGKALTPLMVEKSGDQFVERTLARRMREAGALGQSALEWDISPGTAVSTVVYGLEIDSLKSFADEFQDTTLGSLSLPTMAGIDRMMQHDEIGPFFMSMIGQGNMEYQPVRDFEGSSWAGRVIGTTATGNQGMYIGLSEIARGAGFAEDDFGMAMAKAIGIYGDFAFPAEEWALKPITGPLTRVGQAARMAHAAPTGSKAHGALLGLAPVVGKKTLGSADTDLVSLHSALVRKHMNSRMNEGLDPFTGLPPVYKQKFYEMVGMVADPAEVEAALERTLEMSRTLKMGLVTDALDNGTPLLREMRESTDYARVKSEIDKFVESGQVSDKDAIGVMSILEWMALRAAHDDRVANIKHPQDFFASLQYGQAAPGEKVPGSALKHTTDATGAMESPIRSRPAAPARPPVAPGSGAKRGGPATPLSNKDAEALGWVIERRPKMEPVRDPVTGDVLWNRDGTQRMQVVPGEDVTTGWAVKDYGPITVEMATDGDYEVHVRYNESAMGPYREAGIADAVYGVDVKNVADLVASRLAPGGSFDTVEMNKILFREWAEKAGAPDLYSVDSAHRVLEMIQQRVSPDVAMGGVERLRQAVELQPFMSGPAAKFIVAELDDAFSAASEQPGSAKILQQIAQIKRDTLKKALDSQSMVEIPFFEGDFAAQSWEAIAMATPGHPFVQGVAKPFDPTPESLVGMERVAITYAEGAESTDPAWLGLQDHLNSIISDVVDVDANIGGQIIVSPKPGVSSSDYADAVDLLSAKVKDTIASTADSARVLSEARRFGLDVDVSGDVVTWIVKDRVDTGAQIGHNLPQEVPVGGVERSAPAQDVPGDVPWGVAREGGPGGQPGDGYAGPGLSSEGPTTRRGDAEAPGQAGAEDSGATHGWGTDRSGGGVQDRDGQAVPQPQPAAQVDERLRRSNEAARQALNIADAGISESNHAGFVSAGEKASRLLGMTLSRGDASAPGNVSALRVLRDLMSEVSTAAKTASADAGLPLEARALLNFTADIDAQVAHADYLIERAGFEKAFSNRPPSVKRAVAERELSRVSDALVKSTSLRAKPHEVYGITDREAIKILSDAGSMYLKNLPTDMTSRLDFATSAKRVASMVDDGTIVSESIADEMAKLHAINNKIDPRTAPVAEPMRPPKSIKATDWLRSVTDIAEDAPDALRHTEGGTRHPRRLTELSAGLRSGAISPQDAIELATDALDFADARVTHDQYMAGLDILMNTPSDMADRKLLHDMLKNAENRGVLRRGEVYEPDPDHTLKHSEGGTVRGWIQRNLKTGQIVIKMFETGKLDTLFHENGHLMRFVLEKPLAEILVKYFGGRETASGFDPGRVRMDILDEERAADAFMWWIKTRIAPNGRVRVAFERLYLETQNMWAALRPSLIKQTVGAKVVGAVDEAIGMRGGQPLLPKSVAIDLDAKLRPDKLYKSETVSVWENVIGTLQPIELRSKKGPSVNRNKDVVYQALGLKDSSKEIQIHQLVEGLTAHISADIFRQNSLVQDSVRLTTRTIVPASRVENVRRRAVKYVEDYGIKVRDLSFKDRGSTLVLNEAQAKGMHQMVRDLLDEPISTAIPLHMREAAAADFDPAKWSEVSTRDYTAVVESVIDVKAGIGASRLEAAEAVSPTALDALGSAVVKMGEAAPGDLGATFAHAKRAFSKSFIIADDLKGMSPEAKEIAQETMREVGAAPSEFLNLVRRMRNENPKAVLMDALRSMTEQRGGMIKMIATPQQIDDALDATRDMGAARKKVAREMSYLLPGETEAKIAKVHAEVGIKTDVDLAAELGVTPADIGAYRRKHKLEPAARVSSIAAFHEHVGFKSDDDVAKMAGVTPATVAQYRKSHNIKAPRVPTNISDFHARVGIEPDGVIAKEAGVTTSAVAAYRKKKGIPAQWRKKKAKAAPAPAAAATPAPTAAPATPTPAPVAAAAPPPAAAVPLPQPAAEAIEQLEAELVLADFIPYLGVENDSVVARHAEVETKQVKKYRESLGIEQSGTWVFAGKAAEMKQRRAEAEIWGREPANEAEAAVTKGIRDFIAEEKSRIGKQIDDIKAAHAQAAPEPAAAPEPPAAPAAAPEPEPQVIPEPVAVEPEPAAAAAADDGESKVPTPKRINEIVTDKLLDRAASVMKSGGSVLPPYEETALAKLRLFSQDSRSVLEMSNEEVLLLQDSMNYVFTSMMRKQQMIEEMGEKVIKAFAGDQADAFLKRDSRSPFRREQVVMAYRLFVDPANGDWQNLVDFIGDGTAEVPSRARANTKAGFEQMAEDLGMDLEDLMNERGIDYETLPDEEIPGEKPLERVVGLGLLRRNDTGEVVDPALAFARMVITMKMEDAAARMAKKLARIGIEADARKLVGGAEVPGRSKAMKMKATSMVDKEAQIDRVSRYLNEIIQGRDYSKGTNPADMDQLDPRDAAALDPKTAPQEQFAGRILGRHDMEAYLLAVKIADSWGITPKGGAATRFNECDFGGTRMLIPDALEQEIRRAFETVSNMTYDPSAWVASGDEVVRAKPDTRLRAAIQTLVDYNPITVARLKAGMTTGLMLANAPYYLGNYLGDILMMHQGVGLVGAAKHAVGAVAAVPTAIAAATPAGMVDALAGAKAGKLRELGQKMVPSFSGQLGNSPEASRALMGRLWGHGDYKPEARPIITKDGRIYSIDDLEEMARTAGLRSSFLQAETARSIAQDLRDTEPNAWAKLRTWRDFGHAEKAKIIAKGATIDAAKWWQSTLIDAASAIDNYFRSGVFIDSLIAGKSPAEAAQLARTTMLDYSALTDFERNKVRKWILFYSFQRKSMDLFYYTLARNPERIIGQVKLIRDLHREFTEGDPDILLKDWEKMRLPVYAREANADSGKNKVMYLAPPIPAMDIVNLAYEVFSGDTTTAVSAVLGKVHPVAQKAIEIALEKDIYYGNELGRYDSVPRGFMEFDRCMGGYFERMMDIEPTDVPDPLYAEVVGEQEYQPSTKKGKVLWSIWSDLFQFPGAGRSINTLQAMDRANLGPVELINRAAYEGYLIKEQMGLTADVPYGKMPTGKDEVGPRAGFSKIDETLAVLGIKPRYVPTPEQALAGVNRTRAALLDKATDEMKTEAEAKAKYLDERAIDESLLPDESSP